MFGRYLSHHCIAVTNVSFLMKESINWGLANSYRVLVYDHCGRKQQQVVRHGH